MAWQTKKIWKSFVLLYWGNILVNLFLVLQHKVSNWHIFNIPIYVQTRTCSASKMQLKTLKIKEFLTLNISLYWPWIRSHNLPSTSTYTSKLSFRQTTEKLSVCADRWRLALLGKSSWRVNLMKNKKENFRSNAISTISFWKQNWKQCTNHQSCRQTCLLLRRTNDI